MLRGGAIVQVASLDQAKTIESVGAYRKGTGCAFCEWGFVTPADAALMMQLGCDGVFVGNEAFECLDPYRNVRAIM
ncbi:pyridoxal 5'-phosphate synthase-like subunit PDX1.2 [Tanacetum coccineum]